MNINDFYEVLTLPLSLTEFKHVNFNQQVFKYHKLRLIISYRRLHIYFALFTLVHISNEPFDTQQAAQLPNM